MAATFDARGALGGDTCYQQFRDGTNARILDYIIFNTYDPYCRTDQRERVREFSAVNQRHYKEGYGDPVPCVMENEPAAEGTRECGRKQLNPRVFTAAPGLGRGMPMPEVESALQQGEYTYERKQCTKPECDGVDTFVPLIPCIESLITNKQGTFPLDDRVGVPTRDPDRQRDFFKQLGYELVDGGRVWQKRVCQGAPPPSTTTK